MGAKKALAAVFFFIFSSAAQGQEFTPFEVEDMIKSGFASCHRSQMKNPEAATLGQDLIQKYCQCFAHKSASRTTRAETEAHARGELLTAAQIEKVQGIGRECQREIAR